MLESRIAVPRSPRTARSRAGLTIIRPHDAIVRHHTTCVATYMDNFILPVLLAWAMTL